MYGHDTLSRPSRRTFVKGLAMSGAAASLGWLREPAWAQTPARAGQTVLTGTAFDLRIGESPIDITGRTRTALTINGTMPGPLLRWKEGDTVTLRVSNTLEDDTSIHWHGLILPANMDGVPGLSFAGIHPGATYEYRFPVRQHGTYGTTAIPASRSSRASTRRSSSSRASPSRSRTTANMS